VKGQTRAPCLIKSLQERRKVIQRSNRKCGRRVTCYCGFCVEGIGAPSTDSSSLMSTFISASLESSTRARRSLAIVADLIARRAAGSLLRFPDPARATARGLPSREVASEKSTYIGVRLWTGLALPLLRADQEKPVPMEVAAPARPLHALVRRRCPGWHRWQRTPLGR
jgi:hypothetical protein